MWFTELQQTWLTVLSIVSRMLGGSWVLFEGAFALVSARDLLYSRSPRLHRTIRILSPRNEMEFCERQTPTRTCQRNCRDAIFCAC